VADLDFARLRGEVENATRLPGFDAVQRRARRVRRRDRLGVAAAVAATLGLATPVGLAALHAQPGLTSPVVGPDRPVTATPPAEDASPSPDRRPPSAVVVNVRAVTGTDLTHLYAAVDVCTTTAQQSACSLEISPVPQPNTPPRPPVVINQLREKPAAQLSDVELTPLTERSLLLSGVLPGGARRYARISVPQSSADFAGGASELTAPDGRSAATATADRPLQLREFGEVYGARAEDARITRIPRQPPVDRPVLAAGVAPGNGWWVTGTDRASGELAVSVSHDRGQSWTTRRLGVTSTDTPALASHDGSTAYLFTRSGLGITVLRTADGGASWVTVASTLTRLPAEVAPAGSRLGALVRPDASVLVWVDDGNVPAYFDSTDQGRTFASTSGPAARVVAVPDGYVAVTSPPAISRDARTWTPLPGPAYLTPTA
jgi:hypothetical protein